MEQNNWILDPGKFLSTEQARRLLKTARLRANKAHISGNKVGFRDYFVIHLALSTGLRVMEITQLNCGDLLLGEVPSVLVSKGKGNKKRLVSFNVAFKKHCLEYLSWKQKIGESIEPDAPLLVSSNTGKHLTTRALQKAFKCCARIANLGPSFSIHCLRHTYACHLYKASNYNLRLVQKQLGHSQISTTMVYADVMKPDLHKALKKLYK